MPPITLPMLSKLTSSCCIDIADQISDVPYPSKTFRPNISFIFFLSCSVRYSPELMILRLLGNFLSFLLHIESSTYGPMHNVVTLFSCIILKIIAGAGADFIRQIVDLFDNVHISCARPHAKDIFATHSTTSFSLMSTLLLATL